MSLKHGDQNLYKNDFSYFTNKMIIDKHQFWIHCKSKTVYYMYKKKTHHSFYEHNNNLAAKKIHDVRNFVQTKRNWNNPDVSLSLPFFLILIDASYFWNYSDTDSIIIIQLKYSWKLVTLYCVSLGRIQCSVTFSYIKHKTTSNKNEETLK